MQHRIATLSEKKLVGKRMTMSFAQNTTPELWKNFMTQREQILNQVGDEMYSVQCYEPHFFDDFNPQKTFEKWATVEIADFDEIPPGMQALTLPSGLYVVFLYKGAANEGADAFRYIFQAWLPQSEYKLDSRPHFEVLGEKYKNNHPDSEEEIWIPIALKS